MTVAIFCLVNCVEQINREARSEQKIFLHVCPRSDESPARFVSSTIGCQDPSSCILKCTSFLLASLIFWIRNNLAKPFTRPTIMLLSLPKWRIPEYLNMLTENAWRVDIHQVECSKIHRHLQRASQPDCKFNKGQASPERSFARMRPTDDATALAIGQLCIDPDLKFCHRPQNQ